MDLDNALVMRGLLFPRMYFFFLEHDAQVHSGIIQKIIPDFQCNQHLDYFGGSLRICVFKRETVIL